MARHLYIAGVDRWSDLIKDSLQIEAILTYQIDSARFRIRGGQPSEGDEVIIEDDALGRLFAGIIVKVALADISPDRMEKIWQVECDDYTAVLDRKLVVETYCNMTADAIFRDIVAKYCPGFTTNGVRSGAPVVEELIFDYRPPSECFKELCDYTGWQWQVTYYKDLQFFNPQELNQPASITLEPGGYFRNLKHTIDQQGLRNRVYVRGGTMLSDPWTYEVKADGSARAWVLPHKPHDISLTVGGVAKTVGIEYVDDEGTKDFLMNYQEKYVRCSAQTPTPDAGTTLSFTYRYDIDVITMVEDVASQQAIAAVQGGDGVYEHVIIDDSLTTIDAAEAAGNADLREHANPQVKGSFETEIPGWQPGQLVTINLPDRGITGTFLVQKVTITPATDTLWTYRVEYGGRLLGIADWLQALWKAQQKKKLNETALLHKFHYGAETAEITDEVQDTLRMPPWVVEQGKAFTVKPEEFICQPIDASFSRSSVAYLSDGTQVAANVPRFEAGNFGQAVMVEEGTTNKIETEGGASQDWTRWSHWGNRTYWQSETQYDDPVMGKVFQGVCNNPTYLYDYFPYSISSGAVYTATIWLKASSVVSDLSARAYFIIYQDNQYVIVGSTTKTITLTTEWQKFEWQITATATASAAGFGIGSLAIPAGTTVYAARPQLEQKPYSTSFINGTRSPETLTIPTAAVLNPQEGTVEFWWNPQQPSSGIIRQSSSPKLLQIGSYYSNASLTLWAIYYSDAEPMLYLYVKGQSNSGWSLMAMVKSSGSGWYRPGEFHHFAITWVNGNNFKVYVDGVLAGGPYTISDPVTSWAGGIAYLPGDGDGRDYKGTTNSFIDDLRISSRARTDEEIGATYASGLPLELDGDTTYLVSFNGSLQNELYKLSEGKKEISTIGTQLTMNRGKFRTSTDGQNWTDWQDAEGLKEVPYPGYVEVESLLNAETAVYNFKKPFVATDIVCGFVMVSA